MTTRAMALLVPCLLGAPRSAVAQEPSIRDLDWLVGRWSFEDVQIAGEYREAGTRDCDYVLGGDFIRCESRGVDHRGRERAYLWFFNYNARD